MTPTDGAKVAGGAHHDFTCGATDNEALKSIEINPEPTPLSPSVDERLVSAGIARSELPLAVTPTAMLRRPTVSELAEQLGLLYRPTSLHIHDVVVVGAGPAGLAAGVYGASEGLDTVILEKSIAALRIAELIGTVFS